MKRSMIYLLLCLSLPLTGNSQTVTIGTDKAIYRQGDSLHITIQYLNEQDTTVTLNFTSSCQFEYCIDSVRCLSEHIGCYTVLTSVSILAHSTYTWNSAYLPGPLSPGVHQLEGWVGAPSGIPFYGSDTTSFVIDSICTVAYQLFKGWNLLSVPPHHPGGDISALLPTALSRPFIYDGFYLTTERIPSGKGFWLKSDSATMVSVLTSALILDTVDVAPGWNLISSLCVPVPTDSIVSSPPGIILSRFFTAIICDPGACPPYLYPGKGYWVKIREAGILILKGS